MQILQSLEAFSRFSEEDGEDPETLSPAPPRFTAPEARILVVDDNQMNRFVFQGLLKYLQVQVTLAESGKECLNAIAAGHFDLIFMDHLMPELDGIETLHIMKKRSGHLCTDSKVIAVTANAYPGARDVYLKEGFDDFSRKAGRRKAVGSDYLSISSPKNLIRFADENIENIRKETGISYKAKATAENVPATGDAILTGQLSRMGIDVAKGLSYAGNDWSFYLEVLKCFTEEYDVKKGFIAYTQEKSLRRQPI